jgi:hypothetical protein
LLAWLLIYPLGGAFTNDGVPHFLRTLAGAPLAAILTGIGLAISWRTLRRYRFGVTAALLFALLAAAAFSQFCQAYFITYVAPAADAFGFEDQALFAVIRAQAGNADRVCFQGLNGMNSLTLFSYYLRDLHLDIRERMTDACMQPRTLVVVSDRLYAPPGAALIATAQNIEGVVKYYVFLTK